MMDSPNRFDKENYVKLCLSRYRSEHDTPFVRGIWFVYFSVQKQISVHCSLLTQNEMKKTQINAGNI